MISLRRMSFRIRSVAVSVHELVKNISVPFLMIENLSF